MPRKTKSNAIALKPNKIIQAGQRMNIFQNKVLNGALAALEFNVSQSVNELNSENREDEIRKISQRTCKINIQPLFENFKAMNVTPGSDNYNYIEEKLEDLVKQVLKIKEKGGGLTIINIISYAHYDPNDKTVDIRFSQEIVPVMIDMFRDGFPKIRLASMFKFRSSYSMRIYEELCRVKNMENVKKNGHILTLADLCFLLEIDRSKEYRRYDNFKVRVLLSAQKEIQEKAEITFKMEEMRRGKSVHQIRFYDIKEKQQEALQLQLFPDEILNVYKEDLVEDVQVQEFIEAVVVKENIVESKTGAESDTGAINLFEQESKNSTPKFTQEQLENLDKYLEGIFSADEIKEKFPFEYIEFYYEKTKELDAKGIVKSFPNFLYDIIKKDKYKFQENRTKEKTKRQESVSRQKTEKEQLEKKTKESQKQAEKREADRLEKVFDLISDDLKKKYLQDYYTKNPFAKSDNGEIHKATKWVVAEMYEKIKQQS